MTKAFICVLSCWRKGKEKWCTEGERQRCGFCRCECTRLFLLADLERVRAGFFPWDKTVYSQMLEKEGRMPLSSDPVTKTEKLRSVHHLPSSPQPPGTHRTVSTSAAQGVLTSRWAASPGWATSSEAGPQRKSYMEKVWGLHVNMPRLQQRYLLLKYSTELRYQGSGWGSSKEELTSHLRWVHGMRQQPEREGHFLPNILQAVCLFRWWAEKGENYLLNDGLTLPCRCLLADLLHALSIIYLLWYFTGHVHAAKNVVVSDDPLMVSMPCIVPQLGSQNRNMIAVPLGEETYLCGIAQVTMRADSLCSV